jgi:hypothetical protein
MDRTREVVLARSEVEQQVRGREIMSHDYARTSHRAQGVTVDRSVVAFHHESAALSRQFGAVAMTRSREDMRVIVSAQGAEARERDPAAESPHWPRGRERPDDRQQQLFVDPSVREAALREAGMRLSRDAPGETTLGYRDAPERAAEARERQWVHLRDERFEREPVTAVAERDGDRRAMVRERSREGDRKETQARRDTPAERAGADRGRGDRGAVRAEREDDAHRDDLRMEE